jgi:predicted phosphoadenosine phosphosulfate sulfurtransferase
MARTKKKATNQDENMRVQTMEEWLAAGNKITICPPGMRSEEVVTKFNGGRGRKKKTAAKKKN